MRLVIVNQTKIKINELRLKALFKKLLFASRQKRLRNKNLLDRKEITLVFLGSVEMKKINKKYRQKNKATDVLSFSPTAPDSIGEIVFCIDVLNKQAAEQKHSLGHEFLYMLVHGLMHLLKYDHETSKREQVTMFKLQDKLFVELTEQKINLDCFHVTSYRN